MNEEYVGVDFEKVKKQIERKQFRDKVKTKLHDASQWIVDNKEVVLVAAPVVMTVTKGTFNIGGKLLKHHNLKLEEKLKDRRIYDRSTGHYVETRRKLKSTEWAEFDRRRRQGYSVQQIINDMGLNK